MFIEDPLPNVQQAYNKVLKEECVLSLTTEDEEKPTGTAFVVQGNRSNDKSKLLCTVWNKTGLKPKSCFTIIGYPKWWQENGK